MTTVTTTTKIDRHAQLQKERQESYALLAVNVIEETDDVDEECTAVDQYQKPRESAPESACATSKWNHDESETADGSISNSNDHRHQKTSSDGNQLQLHPRTQRGGNASTVSDLTDSLFSSLGDSFSGFGLDSISEMGWDSVSGGLGSILKRNDENCVASLAGAGFDAFRHCQEGKNCVWSDHRITNDDSRMSDLMNVDCFAEAKHSFSVARVKERKRELDLLEAYNGGMRDSISIAHDKAMTKQRESTMVVEPSIDEEEAGDNNLDNHHERTIKARLGMWGMKTEKNGKNVISLSPMCRISVALNEMFGDEVGTR
ncbi:hypothetical protein ACHAXS_005142 [Conticribra weissflogii]